MGGIIQFFVFPYYFELIAAAFSLVCVLLSPRWFAHDRLGRQTIACHFGAGCFVWAVTAFSLVPTAVQLPFARFGFLVHAVMLVAAFALPQRTVRDRREVAAIHTGALCLSLLLLSGSLSDVVVSMFILFVYFVVYLRLQATTDPVEREPFVLFTIYQGLGICALIAALCWGDFPLVDWNNSRAALAATAAPAAYLVGIGCWLWVGFAPLSSSFLSMISSTRDNYLVSLFFVASGLTLYLRAVVPILLAHDVLLTATAVIGGLTMLLAALLLFGEKQPRKVGGLLFLSQLGFALLALQSKHPEDWMGLQALFGVALISIAGIFVTSSLLLLRLGRGYSQSCSGIASALPSIASCFLFFILAFVGFPGTFGFVSEELMIRDFFETRPVALLVAATALSINGFSCFRIYGRLFLGDNTLGRFESFRLKGREKLALAGLVIMLLLPGIFPEQLAQLAHQVGDTRHKYSSLAPDGN